MLRLFPRPGLLTGVVVAAAVASGMMFGVVAASTALALREAARRADPRP